MLLALFSFSILVLDRPLRGPLARGRQTIIGAYHGAVSVVATNGATFNLTGVKLEIGSVATPFNRQSLAKSLADCQRYYALPNSGIVCGSVYAAAAGMATYQHWEPPVTMRAAPTVVGSWNNLVNATAGSFTSSLGPIQGFITSVAAGPFSGSMLIASVTAEL